MEKQLKLGFVFLFAACLLSPPPIEAIHFKYCDGDGNYAVKVDGVGISPYPVISGKPATFRISASTVEAISGGRLNLEVFYFGINVHKETHNLCEEASCPLDGKFVLSHTQTLPRIAPPGSYTLRMEMKDGKGRQLTCISFKFKIKFGSALSSI